MLQENKSKVETELEEQWGHGLKAHTLFKFFSDADFSGELNLFFFEHSLLRYETELFLPGEVWLSCQNGNQSV